MIHRTRKFRHMAGALALLALVAAGCAGPSKLAERSEQKLSGGDIWRAWQLATRALDREPMNPRAKSAAAAAGQVIAEDWQRRIQALAQVDSMRAAEQVLEFTAFRANAANYTTISVPASWNADEQTLRRAAAASLYAQARQASAARRPRLAFDRYHACERFVPNYRDALRLADLAFEHAVTRVAVMPFGYSGKGAEFGREVSDHWRDALSEALAPPRARFTRVLGASAVDQRLTVTQLGHLSREDAVRVGRKAGAQRVVWGSVGPITSETGIQWFRDRVARRIVQKGEDGRTTVHWVQVPIEVVARVRDVQVNVDYEVASTADGSSLAHEHAPLSKRARVVWTSYVPEGDVGSYALVSEELRTSDPERAKDIETRWKSVCGETTTLAQVLAARRESRGEVGYDRGSLGRFAAGTAFVFLQELPPAQDLAWSALQDGWQPLLEALARLDSMDDVDLGVAAGSDDH